MPGPRAQTETFLFSDIEGSTRLLRQLGDAYEGVLEDHRRLLRSAFAAHGGEEQGTEGDSFFVVFGSATDGVAAAVAGQLALAEHQVRVRIGLHSGEAVRAAGGYIGLAIHEAARISAVGHGGQIVVSEATRMLAEGLPEAVSFRDLGEHRLKDFERPARLFQVGHAGLGDRFPPLRTLAMLPNNLPKAITTFVGRAGEIRELADLLRATRLLTLTGPGGIGKTRLASELATAAAEHFSGGVWMAELASVEDPDRVAGVVAASAGLREEAGRSPTDALAEWIGGGQVLLVLDNCEHVLDACAEVITSLLPACPGLTVLATSRERLAIEGETAWPVPPLSETAQLFLERARAARPGLVVDEATLARICARLEGIPLAVELAAARVAALSAEQLEARLDDRFRALGGEQRGRPQRHQTLRAVVDWSHALLAEPERVLLRRLAVVGATFTLEAAEAVDDGAVDALTRLVDQSLVMFDGRRYRMLETIREYASEKLDEAGDRGPTTQRLLRWTLRLAEDGAAQLEGPDQAHWLLVLAANHDTIRAALRAGLGGRSHRRAAQLAAAMGRFWLVRGHWDEGRAWYARALARPAAPAVQGRMLARAAALAAVQGDDEESRAMSTEALAIAREEGDRRTEADAQFVRAVGFWERRELGDAEESFTAALRLNEAVGHAPGAAAAVAGLGTVAWAHNDFGEARRLFEESLAGRERAGDQHGMAVSLNNLAVLALSEGDHDRVRALSEESLRISRELGDTEGIAAALHHLSEAAEALGDVDIAVALAEESLQLGRQLGDRRGIELAESTLARLAHPRGRDDSSTDP